LENKLNYEKFIGHITRKLDLKLNKKSNTYEDEQFQEYILRKTIYFSSDVRKHIHKNLSIPKIAGLGFLCSSSSNLKIVDFGGAAGIDFFVARELFGFNYEWQCIETEALCTAARKTKEQTRGLNFLTFEEYLGKEVDSGPFSLYANSSLQYTESPIGTLETLLGKMPERVAIIRTPVILNGDTRLLQQESSMERNGPQGVQVPKSSSPVSNTVRIVHAEEIRSTFMKSGFEITCESLQESRAFGSDRHRLSRNSPIRLLDILATRKP
jgi:putative methyltransferase (TIGR04325 family)